MQYPPDTIVRLKKTGEFAIIKSLTFLKDGKNFLNYLGEIEGRPSGNYALYHNEIEFEWPPREVFENPIPAY
jgi:hypothetical protein